VNIRPATEQDESVLKSLWEEFNAEVPAPDGFEPDTWEKDWPALRTNMTEGAVFLAQDDDGPAAVIEAAAVEPGRWHVTMVHVLPRARREGIAKALLAAVAAAARDRGAGTISLDVLTNNERAHAVWQRLGFEPVAFLMATPVAALAERLGDAPAGPSRASTHVQSDDRVSIERAVAQFVPRLAEAEIRDAESGWIRIVEPILDADRESQSRLAADLSDRLGAVVVALALEHGAVVRFQLYESGRMVDEYLSLPSFYGHLDRGDELALEANPTLVARLTGADREEVRRVARTGASAADLPPADELYADIARVMGLDIE
jgi:ribosomal protein S18 acetylase RimI-like enzyme